MLVGTYDVHEKVLQMQPCVLFLSHMVYNWTESKVQNEYRKSLAFFEISLPNKILFLTTCFHPDLTFLQNLYSMKISYIVQAKKNMFGWLQAPNTK